MYDSFLNTIVAWQQEINILISDSFDKLDMGDTSMFSYILFIAFLYGLIHALGPGHGKMVIASYFLTRGAKVQDAIKAGFLTSIIHTISALIITGVLFYFFQTSLTHYFQQINTNMYKVSAIFILIIASYLLYDTIKDRNEKEELPKSTNKSLLSVSFSIGIVPCPGVMTIVLFAILMGYFTLGIMSAIAMSIGMGITISLAAVMVTKIKESGAQSFTNLLRYISYFGIFILYTLGILLITR